VLLGRACGQGEAEVQTETPWKSLHGPGAHVNSETQIPHMIDEIGGTFNPQIFGFLCTQVQLN